jgi:hypothetical protein
MSMKNVMQITFKDQSSIKFETLVKKTSDTFLKVHELQEGETPLFLEIEHQQLNTLIELSEVTPYVLLYFDDKEKFNGASFSLNASKSPFSISTQCKRILFLKYPISFQLEDVLYLTLLS